MLLVRWWASLVVTELQACSFVGGLPNVIFWRPFSGAFQFPQTRILCSLIWCWLWCSGSGGVEGSWGLTILGCRSLCLQPCFTPSSIMPGLPKPRASSLQFLQRINLHLQRWDWQEQSWGSLWLDVAREGPRGSVNRLSIFSLFLVPHLILPSVVHSTAETWAFMGSLDGIVDFRSASLTLSVSTFFISLLIFQWDLGKQQR